MDIIGALQMGNLIRIPKGQTDPVRSDQSEGQAHSNGESERSENLSEETNAVPKNLDTVELSQNPGDTKNESTLKKISVIARESQEEDKSGISSQKIEYTIDNDHNVILKMIDSESDTVIRQIPPEELLRISKAIDKMLEQTVEGDREGNAPQINALI